jgi:CheY-like chemotaxis protein
MKMKRIALWLLAAVGVLWLLGLWRKRISSHFTLPRRVGRGAWSSRASTATLEDVGKSGVKASRSTVGAPSSKRFELDLILAPPPELKSSDGMIDDTPLISNPTQEETTTSDSQPGTLDAADVEAVQAGRKGSPLALVADDDRDIRTFATHLLERTGFDVVTAADGDEALQQAIDREPAVCVLDWMTPKHSGLDVLETLRAGVHTGETPVLLFFTADELRDRVEGLVDPQTA